MSRLPDRDVFQDSFYSPAAAAHGQQSPKGRQAGAVFDYYSVVDDAKNEARKLSAEAQREIEKASSKVRGAGGGGIELYSGRYYAACTFGGLMACVSAPPRQRQGASPDFSLRTYTGVTLPLPMPLARPSCKHSHTSRENDGS